MQVLCRLRAGCFNIFTNVHADCTNLWLTDCNLGFGISHHCTLRRKTYQATITWTKVKMLPGYNMISIVKPKSTEVWWLGKQNKQVANFVSTVQLGICDLVFRDALRSEWNESEVDSWPFISLVVYCTFAIISTPQHVVTNRDMPESQAKTVWSESANWCGPLNRLYTCVKTFKLWPLVLATGRSHGRVNKKKPQEFDSRCCVTFRKIRQVPQKVGSQTSSSCLESQDLSENREDVQWLIVFFNHLAGF